MSFPNRGEVGGVPHLGKIPTFSRLFFWGASLMYSVLLFCPLWRNLPVVIIDLTGNWLPVSEVLVASHLYYKLSLSAPFKYSNVNPVLEVLVALTCWFFQIPQTTEPRLKILFGWPGCRNGTLFGDWLLMTHGVCER